MGKKLKVPISTARANPFQLAETLRKAADDTAVVLVREARLAYLEGGVGRQVEKQRDAKPVRLTGGVTSDLDPDTLERAMLCAIPERTDRLVACHPRLRDAPREAARADRWPSPCPGSNRCGLQ